MRLEGRGVVFGLIGWREARKRKYFRRNRNSADSESQVNGAAQI